MKKHFITCLAALSIAAIAISADHSNSITSKVSPAAVMYDTLPKNMDTTDKWKNNDTSYRRRDTSMMRRDSSLRH